MYCLFQDGKEEAAASHAVCMEEDPPLPGEDPPIPDLTVKEYNAIINKSDFFRPAAKVPMMDAGGEAFVCSLLEDKSPWLPGDTGEFYQDSQEKQLPILNATMA